MEIETRDILDGNGNVVGQLTLPADTSEDVWAEKLSHYTYVPATPTLPQIVESRVNGAADWGVNLILSIAVENVLMGITQAGRTKDVSDYCSTVARYLREGSLYAALSEVTALLQAGAPEELNPFITNDRLTATQGKIKQYLGL